MPALPTVANVLKMTTIWTVGVDTDVASIHHLQFSGPSPSAANLTTAAGTIRAAWDTNMKALLNSNNVLTTVILQDLTTNTGAEGQSVGSNPGTRTGAQNAGGVAVVMNHAIARRYRGGHPKNFLPYGSATDLQTAQAWTSSFANSMTSGYAAFITAITGLTIGSASTTGIVNVSYYSGFTVVISPTTGRARNVPKVRASVSPDVITSTVASTKVGSQRRRNHP